MIPHGNEAYTLLPMLLVLAVGLFFVGRRWVKESIDRRLLSGLEMITVTGKWVSFERKGPVYILSIQSEVMYQGKLRLCRTEVGVHRSVYQEASLSEPSVNPLFVGPITYRVTA